MLHSFKELFKVALRKGRKRVIVSGGDDLVTVEALRFAREKGLVDAILVGNKERIEKIARDFQIIEADDWEMAAKSAKMISEGEGDIIMKGKQSTADFMRGILDDSANLKSGTRMSHIAVIESKSYHKLLFMTDGGININPNLDIKKDILLNAVKFAQSVGIECPKVAVVTAVEKVNSNMIETVDAVDLVDMAKKGEFGKCKVEGPIGMDMAVSREACEMKNAKSEVGGDVDILLVPDIASGNISAKSLLWLGGAKIGGIVCGVRVPCIMLSRSDTKAMKLNSIAIGVVVA